MMTKLRKIEIEDGAMDPAYALPNVEEFFTHNDLEEIKTPKAMKPVAKKRDDRQMFAVPQNGWLSGMRRRLLDA